MFLLDFLFPKKAVLYLDRQGMSVIKDNKIVSELRFPSEMVSHLEILDPVQLEKTIGTFFHTLKFRGQMTIILSNALLFCTKAPLSQEINVHDPLIMKYLSKVPFGLKMIDTKIIQLPTAAHSLLIATNASFFQLVRRSCATFGIRVTRVIPEIIFELSSGKTLSPVELSASLRRDRKRLAEADFLK